MAGNAVEWMVVLVRNFMLCIIVDMTPPPQKGRGTDAVPMVLQVVATAGCNYFGMDCRPADLSPICLTIPFYLSEEAGCYTQKLT